MKNVQTLSSWHQMSFFCIYSSFLIHDAQTHVIKGVKLWTKVPVVVGVWVGSWSRPFLLKIFCELRLPWSVIILYYLLSNHLPVIPNGFLVWFNFLILITLILTKSGTNWHFWILRVGSSILRLISWGNFKIFRCLSSLIEYRFIVLFASTTTLSHFVIILYI